jgi:hypothetical protein
MAINFEQLAQSMGFTGAAADQLARSLQAASNSADRSASALNAEAAAVARATQQTRTLGDQMASTLDTLVDFTGQIINTADGMASSNTVFTQISPLISKTTSIIGEMTKAGGELLGVVGTLVGGVPGGIIATMAGKLFGNVTAEIAKLAGEIFNQYLQQGEKVMGAFNSLSSVGVTFGGSLTEMQRIIRDTGMPLEMLAKVAQSNAENLALLGGGVSGALETVAKAARNDLGPQLVTLYGGFANLSDELVDYMAMERRRGVDQDLLSDNNIESTKAYLYQLKEISALTGKSSKQLKQEIEQRSRNAATQGMLSKMSDTQRKQYDAAMLKVPDAVKGPLQDAFLAFSRGMEPVSTEFLQLQAAAPEAAESIRRMALAANKGPDEFNRVMDQESKNLTVSAGKLTEQMGDLFYLQQAGRLSSSLVDTLNKVITDINSNSGRLKTMGEDSAKFAEQTAALVANAGVFTTSIASVYAAQANLAVKLNGIVLGTEGSGEKLSSFAEAVVYTTGVMGKMVDGLDDIVTMIGGYGIPREQRIAAQTERITQTQTEIEGIRRARHDLLRQHYEPTQQIDENTPVPDEIRRQINHLDQNIQLRLQRLENLEKGIKNINDQEDAREAEEKRKKREQELREQNKTMLLGNTSGNGTSPVVSSIPVDFEPLRAMLQPSFDNQTVALRELATALGNQGGQIRRAVDRMA